MDSQTFIITLVVFVVILMAFLAYLISVIALESTDDKHKGEAIKWLGRSLNKLINLIKVSKSGMPPEQKT